MATWFLLLGLFLPRTVLFFSYLFGSIPTNSTPLAEDIIGAIFAPRFLIAYWIYDLNQYQCCISNLWIFLYIIFGILSLNLFRVKKVYVVKREDK